MDTGQPVCDDIGLGILLTDQSTAWVTVTQHNETGETLLVELVPAEAGYWHIRVTSLRQSVTDSTIRPVSPYGVGVFLPGMGVTLPCDWKRQRKNA